MALDRKLLTEYDTILLVDRSGSMADKAKGFKDRWTQAQEITMGLAMLAAQVDDDGITVIQFGGKFDAGRDVIDGVSDADMVTKIFTDHQPAGSTPLHDALNAAFAKKNSSSKKAIIMVVTDGVPNDEKAVSKCIIDEAAKLNDASECRILFLQVGDDKHAAEYLNGLDNSLSGAKFDIVNAITFEDADGLTPDALFERAITDSH